MSMALKQPFPEPNWTPENMGRKRGETTFSICGWCEYAGMGCYRHNCALETSCSLLSTPVLNSLKLRWHTPCILKMLGTADIDEIVAKKMHDIETYQKQIVKASDEITVLYGMRQSLNPTPMLAPHRGAEHFNVDDNVMVCEIASKTWHPATVVVGYRHHDGIVSYVGNFTEDIGQHGCGTSSPCVMLASEFEYFLRHPEAFRVWIDLSSMNTLVENFNDVMYEAFERHLRQRGGAHE